MNSHERIRIGEKASLTGIVCNLLLFALKMAVGVSSHSLSVVADAFNNMTDFISSLVSLFAVKLSEKPADREHPYGHGRTEYIASFLVAVLIFVVGTNLLRSSVERILAPAPLQMSSASLVILAATVLVKLLLFLYFRHMGMKAELPVLLLSAKDALFDCLTTLITICALIFSPYVSFNIDAWAALGLSCLILFSSVQHIRDSASPLLGRHPKDGLTDALTSLAESHEEVLSVHDVMLHDYGYHLYMGSMHIELPESLAFHDAHAVADAIEQEALKALGVKLVVHADPVAVNDPQRIKLRQTAQHILDTYNRPISIHDFQLDTSSTSPHLSFDLQVPYDTPVQTEKELENLLISAFLQEIPNLICQIHFDHI